MSPAAATVPHTAAPCESFPGTTGRICQNIIYSAGASEKVAYSSTYIVLWCTLCPQYCRIELFLRRLEIHFLPWSTAKIMCVCVALFQALEFFSFSENASFDPCNTKKKGTSGSVACCLSAPLLQGLTSGLAIRSDSHLNPGLSFFQLTLFQCLGYHEPRGHGSIKF